jgi:hypothetical protein
MLGPSDGDGIRWRVSPQGPVTLSRDWITALMFGSTLTSTRNESDDTIPAVNVELAETSKD